MCVYVYLQPNLWTGASRHQTEGTSGTSEMHASKQKAFFLKICLFRTRASLVYVLLCGKHLLFMWKTMFRICNVHVVIFCYTYM